MGRQDTQVNGLNLFLTTIQSSLLLFKTALSCDSLYLVDINVEKSNYFLRVILVWHDWSSSINNKNNLSDLNIYKFSKLMNCCFAVVPMVVQFDGLSGGIFVLPMAYADKNAPMNHPPHTPRCWPLIFLHCSLLYHYLLHFPRHHPKYSPKAR